MFCWSPNTLLLSSSSTIRATRQFVTKQVGTNKCAVGLNRHHHYLGQALLRYSSPGWSVWHTMPSSSSSNLSTTASPPFLPADTDVNDLLPRTNNGSNSKRNITISNNNNNKHKHARFCFWTAVERRKQLARYSSSSFIPRRHDDDDAAIDFTNVNNNNNNNNGNSNTDMTSMMNNTDIETIINHNVNNKSSSSSSSSLLRFCNNFNKPRSPSSSSKLPFNRRYQQQQQYLHRLLSSPTIISSSSQLSSSMMLMLVPSLSSPLRLCSSSSSSSQPSSESSNNNNNDNNNNIDKIDVTSFADSAKKILQDQKIATLICTKKVRDVLPSTYFTKENLVENEELFNREAYKSNLPAIAKIIFMPAAEILSSTTASDLNLTLKQYETMSHFLATIQLHPTMTEFMTNDDFRLVAKLNVLTITTVYDWYNTSQQARGRNFDDEQTGIINDACAALYRKAEEENKRQEKLETTAQDLGKVFQHGPLTPGKSHRHTNPFAYGALARDEVMKDLADEAKKFFPGAKKEYLRIFATHSMPRQGKTRLGDELGHNKNFYGRLNGGKATADNTFIFNVTMNSNWQAVIDPDDAERKSDVELFSLTKRELCRRIVGAAAGIYTKTAYRGDKAAICEAFIEARDCNFEKVCQDVQQIVAKKSSVNIEDSNFVYVFDEITNLEEFFDKRADCDNLKAAFYSMITPLIGYNCLVFLSGFSEARDALSKSGRKLFTVKLSPISSVSLRRELHTMKSKFFQFCAKNSGSKPRAIYYFELVKSAPGLLGTLLEKLQGIPEDENNDNNNNNNNNNNHNNSDDNNDSDDNNTTNVNDNDNNIERVLPARSPVPPAQQRSLKQYELEDHVKSIPLIHNLDETDCNSMLEILHLKSVFFLSSSIDTQINEFVNKALERASKNKIADCLFRDGVKDLHSARLEPLFVEAAKGKWPKKWLNGARTLVLDEYWLQLKNFSEVESNIVVKEDTKAKDCVVSSNDLPSVFRRFRTTNSVDATTKTRIEKFKEQTLTKPYVILERHLRGSFFEDAIAAGLLAQRQFRRQAISSFEQQEKMLPNPSSSLSDYLHGSTVVCSIRPSKVYEVDFPGGSILWNPPSSSSSSASSSTVSLATSIIEFDGHFPCVEGNNNNNRDDVSPEHCDSLECVLIPRRLQCDVAGIIHEENNPLVDAISNERFDDDSLVQFWIDGKHRQDQRFGKTPVRTNNINFSLKEIARRATVEREGKKKSNIRHIVHIVITPFRKDSPETTKKVERLRKLTQESVSLPPPLKSYTLCFVSPDDLSENKAFENLVSQPIALTVPLMDQQMTESWTCGLPAPAEWWNYNATAGCRSRVRDRLNKSEADELLHKHCPVASRMTQPEEFAQWRRIRFNGDCAIGIGHLFKTEKEASDTLIFEGDTNKELPRSEKIPRESVSVSDNKSDSNVEAKPSLALEIPFGCILEALGILPPRAHGTSYCQYDVEPFRFKLRLVDNNDNSKNTTTTTSTTSATTSTTTTNGNNNDNDNDNDNVRFEISIIDEKSISTKWFVKIKQAWLLEQIRVGHILRFKYPGTPGKHVVDSPGTPKTHDVDYQENGTLSDLWQKKFTEYHDEKKGVDKLEAKKTPTCSDLWNMSLSEFSDLLLKEDAERRFRLSAICEALQDAERNTSFEQGSHNTIVVDLAQLVEDEIAKYRFFLIKKK